MSAALSRVNDPSTSFEAAASIEGRLPELEAIVLEELRKRGDDGATSHELAAALELSLVTVSPRLKPLQSKGLVIDSGFKRTGESGRKSIVWRIRRRQMEQTRLAL
jgi:predicted ArsR family transcriptional regulator